MIRSALIAALIALAPPVQAAREQPAPLQPPAPPKRYAMQPVGQGTLTWFGLRVYDAALWSTSRRAKFNQPFALVVRYARALDGAAIAERSLDEIARLGAGGAAQREAWARQLRVLLPDVEAGDEIAGVHRPGAGARFYLNGRPLGEIADAAFSRAFFSIWLDPRTSEPELRAALIGQR